MIGDSIEYDEPFCRMKLVGISGNKVHFMVWITGPNKIQEYEFSLLIGQMAVFTNLKDEDPTPIMPDGVSVAYHSRELWQEIGAVVDSVIGEDK